MRTPPFLTPIPLPSIRIHSPLPAAPSCSVPQAQPAPAQRHPRQPREGAPLQFEDAPSVPTGGLSDLWEEGKNPLWQNPLWHPRGGFPTTTPGKARTLPGPAMGLKARPPQPPHCSLLSWPKIALGSALRLDQI